VPVSVRGAGHHHAGYAAGDGALMVDFSGWRDVSIDPAAGTATVQPGVPWAGLDRAAQQAGLATTGADVPVVGVAGTTLGGGLGWLHRRFGLSCDNLLAAQLVTAAGELQTVDDTEHPELLWALRGGGGAFGVVASLTLALHPVPPVRTAAALLPLDQARSGLAAYRELTAAAPDELFARAMLMPAPPAPFVPEPLHGRPVLMLAAAWIGDPAGADAGLRPLQALGGPPAQPISYLGLQQLSERGFPGRVRASARGHFLDGLGDGLIDVLLDAAGDAPSMSMIQLQPGGGAMARISPGATAFPHRTATHHLHLQGLTPPGQTGGQHAEWVQARDAQIRPYTTGGIYANAATPGDDTDLAAAAYGSNLARLAALKTQLDPAGLFRFTPLSAQPRADRVGTSVLFANDRVRVWEMVLAPGETCAPHRHRNDFLLLYPHAAVMRPHARPGLEHVAPGLVGYVTVGAGGVGPHQITNAGPGPATHYIIELLGPSATPAAQPLIHNGRARPEPEPSDEPTRRPQP
jgi:FAD/FMN-containing dehydrogenase